MSAQPVAARLSKLIPLLGSDHAGEVAATANAIGRILSDSGKDWHDLTAALQRGWDVPKVAPFEAFARRGWWQRTAETCLCSGDYSLRPGEQEFLQSMLHWPTHPSEKQCRWLEAIAAALNLRSAA